MRPINTERLILREIGHEDLEGMFLLDSDPLVHRYLLKQPVQSREESAKIIESIRAQYLAHGIARWAVVEKQTGEFVGWSGLRWEDENLNGITGYHDIGFRLIPKYW